ncbi:MAG: c-type cytochrome, partial [Candidatus Margulisiibacteriota bacterium]
VPLDDYEEGAIYFKQDCAACHTLGGGDSVGPDLQGIHLHRTYAWLFDFIKNPQALINKGDKEAVEVYKKFGEMMMPSSGRSDDEISDIIIFISGKNIPKATEKRKDAVDTKAEQRAEIPSPSVIAMGSDLFQGIQKFKNGGITCIACHHVNNKSVVSGGSLARELTKSYSRIGSTGLRGMISNPPFPAMKQAYRDHSITTQDVEALTAFLRHVDEADTEHSTSSHPKKMLFTGTVGLIILLILYGLIFRKRKKGSVNQAIYDRQKIKSQ